MRSIRMEMALPAAGQLPTVNSKPVKFWNMASLSEDEGEIDLFGDVLDYQPTDWWTGEPIDGQFITPEGFAEDLATVKNKKKICVKINSCGGDLYTGIAIHNALKSLSGEVDVEVVGIAASAASLIAMAGKQINMYPGSIMMIHCVSALLWDSYSVDDLKTLIKGMDASNRAAAAIYSAKTGIDQDKILNMMGNEKWMTGQEAVDEGFADNVIKEQNPVSMSMSIDRKILMVNGINHEVSGMKIPEAILKRIPTASVSAQAARINNKPAMSGKTNEGGHKDMTKEELREKYPELVAQIESQAVDAKKKDLESGVSDQVTKAIDAERQRLKDVEFIRPAVGDDKLVEEAMFGEKPMTAAELSLQAMRNSAKNGDRFMKQRKDETAAASGVKASATDPSADASGKASTTTTQDDVKAVLELYNAAKGGKK